MKTKAIAAQSIDTMGRVGVYGIGTDGAMYYKIWSGNTSLPSKTDWLFLDGGFNSSPTAAIDPTILAPWSAFVFCLGLNNEMFFRVVSSFSWPPPSETWQPLGGGFNSPPACESVGDLESGAKIVVAGLGTDNQLYLKVFDINKNQWLPSLTDWLPLGGVLIYEPVIARFEGDSSQNFDIFGVGTDRQMYQMNVNVSQWPPIITGWLPAGGCFTSVPAVVKWSKNRIDVFGLGMDQQMYHRASENGEWIIDWEPLGGVFDSPAAVAAWSANRLDIFGLGTDDQMYHKAWDGNHWLPSATDWEPLGGVFSSAPNVVSTGPDNLHIFGLGTDDQMYHKAWDGNHWLPSATDWEPLGGVFRIPRPTQMPVQLDFDWPITFSAGTALGGSLHVTLFMHGRSRFSGHLHDSGGDSYATSVGCAVIDGKNRAYTFEDFGNVWGILPGPRDHDWNVPAQPNTTLRDNWSDLFACGGAKFGARVDVQSFPPGGLVHNLITVLKDLAGGTPLTVIPLVGSAP